ncbi:MAG: DUF5916 domain-containing protein [Ferruginibacter sp.]
MKYILLFILLLNIQTLLAQDSMRKVPALRNTLPVKIDGIPGEAAWSAAAAIDKLIQQRPVFGLAENEKTRTQAWIMYDDEAVYFGGFNHEETKDSISTELGGRDRLGINDFIGVVFDTYKDEINGVGFYVTALGEQVDLKYSLNNEDASWSTVYQSATKITDSGWSFEMRIPYSALRFSKNKIQDWGINIIRRRTKTGQQFTWSPVDPNKFGLMSQAGRWTNIQNIKSPLRLSFSPYFSSYLDYTPDKNGNQQSSNSVNGGMDVKYGLSKGFTLDLTLIPDFGQVQSDRQVLNLSPFEVRYGENRPFFTEGTELFNKGNLFYSRRIGDRPINAGLTGALAKDGKGTIITNPTQTKLINATKISGRTSKGLGIGFFNAITKPQHGYYSDSINNEYKVETSPWTNYNIVVLDKTLKNNSSVTLVNTNVLRSGGDRDANVTAALFDIYDKKIDWNVWGKIGNSRISGANAGKTISGYNHELNFGKFRGPFNFEVHHFLADDKYQQNDLGYATNNNFNVLGAGAWYKVTKPKSFYNRLFFQARINYSQLHFPRRYQSFSIGHHADAQLKSLWSVGWNININPEQQDFYEARNWGSKFKVPGSWQAEGFFSTNSAKKYAVSFEYGIRKSPKYNGIGNDLSFNNRYRFSDKFNLSLNTNMGISSNDLGFAFFDNVKRDTSFFGLRDRNTVENSLFVKYSFNTKMGINLQARHYWSRVVYSKFFSLKEDGYLQDINNIDPHNDPNINYNFFTVDMVYSWEFAQGSFINLAWKNLGEQASSLVNEKYYRNFSNTISTPHANNLSVKIIYFLDYLDLKKKRKK